MLTRPSLYDAATDLLGTGKRFSMEDSSERTGTASVLREIDAALKRVSICGMI